MSHNHISLVLIAEDQQQEVVVQRLLIARGFSARRITLRINPTGKGSGEQFVRETFIEEVAAFQSRNFILNKALIVITDADTLTVDGRIRQLEKSLKGLTVAHFSFPCLFCIPRRNIETWIHWLANNPVNEESVYPKRSKPGDCQAEVNALVTLSQSSGYPAEMPESLKRWLEDFNRYLLTLQE